MSFNKNMTCITTFFNPAKYQSLLKNYAIFAANLEKQNVNLLTIELSFDGTYQIPEHKNVHRLKSNSIMWQKERLINYGLSVLPDNCDYFAWLDCDLLFSDPNWVEIAIDKFKKSDILQLFKRVFYMPRGHTTWSGEKEIMLQGVIWQNIIHKNWLQRRKDKDLPFSAPGFAWAAKRSIFEDIGGIYDRNIIGSGDTFLVDCLLDSWEIHGYSQKFTPGMKRDMSEWCAKFKSQDIDYDYLPIEIYHLWHGTLKNRRYMDRHDIILENNFDPNVDIILNDNVFEWNSHKDSMHEAIKQYFFDRKEDEL